MSAGLVFYVMGQGAWGRNAPPRRGVANSRGGANFPPESAQKNGRFAC